MRRVMAAMLVLVVGALARAEAPAAQNEHEWKDSVERPREPTRVSSRQESRKYVLDAALEHFRIVEASREYENTPRNARAPINAISAPQLRTTMSATGPLTFSPNVDRSAASGANAA